jgi:Na+/H+-dicarboxylate symporter
MRSVTLAALVAGAAGLGLVLGLEQRVPGYVLLVLGGIVAAWTAPLSLNSQIAFGAGLGVLLGALEGAEFERTSAVGSVFLAGLKMLVAPMILCSVAYGIAGLTSAVALGRLGSRTVATYLLTMVLAAGTGLLVVNAIEPGASGSLRETAFFQQAVGARPAPPSNTALPSFFLAMLLEVLTNPIASLAQGKVLPIVAFAILLGVALLHVGERGRALVELLAAANEAILWMIGVVLRLAPVGVFALIGHLVATVGFRALFENLAEFIAVVIGSTLFHALVTLPALVWLLGRQSPLVFLRGIREALAVAFSTSSSIATLPVTTRCTVDNLGVPPGIASFVLPLGATVNMDGSALYEAIAALFVANVYGIDLSLGQQLVVFVVAILGAIGAPGIPSAGMVTMIVVLEAVGLPTEAVGLLIAIDRLLDTVRTMANVEGDAVTAVIVTRSFERS